MVIEELSEMHTDSHTRKLGLVVEQREASMSTVPSSFAAELVRQSELNATQNNIRIDGSQNVYVGDVINNFYVPPSKRESSSSDDDLISQETKPSRRKFWIAVIIATVLTAVSVGVGVYLAYWTSEEAPSNINYFTRDEWMRGEEKSLELPIRRVIVAHTGGDSCDAPESCKAQVKEIQRRNAHLNDIPYNFLIGGDGSIFEGRGFNFQGEHTANANGSSFNDIGICVTFIGNFQAEPPTDEQIAAFQNFTTYFISQGLIVDDFKIFSQDQLAKPTTVPAYALLEVMKDFPEFYSVSKIYRRDEWGAEPPFMDAQKLDLPIQLASVGNVPFSNSCLTLEHCCLALQELQEYHIDEKNDFGDIAWNFIIGTDEGLIFEGRGFDDIGTHSGGAINRVSIGVAYFGSYTDIDPTQGMFDAMFELFAVAIALGKLSDDYQITTNLDKLGYKGGDALLRIIRNWHRFLEIL